MDHEIKLPELAKHTLQSKDKDSNCTHEWVVIGEGNLHWGVMLKCKHCGKLNHKTD